MCTAWKKEHKRRLPRVGTVAYRMERRLPVSKAEFEAVEDLSCRTVSRARNSVTYFPERGAGMARPEHVSEFSDSGRFVPGSGLCAQCVDDDMPLYTNFCARLFPSSLTSAV